MKVNRYVFPLVIVALFLAIIAAAMVLGLWQTKGGQHRGRGGQHGTASPVTRVAQISIAQ